MTQNVLAGRRGRFSALLTPLLLGLTAALLSGCGGPNLFDRFGNFWSWGLCSGIVVILDIIALVEVLGSGRSTGDKVLWSLVIIFFPILGCLAYYFFGRK